MQHSHCRTLATWLALFFVIQLGSTPWVSSANAQAYPNKSIKLIAPYPPGGGVDTVARLLAERLAARLGQQIIVDNKPGAGATLFAPANTPRDIIAMLNKVANEVLRQAELRERLLALGIVVTGGTSEEVQARIPLEMSKWATVVKTANIKIE